MKTLDKKLVVILGPTASGKSAWALKLARKYHGAIVSADSRQIYQKMDIGTNKPTKQEQKLVPHYLIDLVRPSAVYTVARYQHDAQNVFELIWKKNWLPFLVGGTGLYLDAVIENWKIPPRSDDLRLRKRLEKMPINLLVKKLTRLDPASGVSLDLKNKRRLIRALEVVLATGQSFVELKRKKPTPYRILKLGVQVERDILYRKINDRVDMMIRRGLISEVKRLSKKYSWESPAMTGIGYKQIGQYLRSEISRDEAIRLVKRDTRRYTKRQLTWFRRDKRIHWVKSLAQAEVLVKRFIKN